MQHKRSRSEKHPRCLEKTEVRNAMLVCAYMCVHTCVCVCVCVCVCMRKENLPTVFAFICLKLDQCNEVFTLPHTTLQLVSDDFIHFPACYLYYSTTRNHITPLAHVPDTDALVLRVAHDELLAWMEDAARHVVVVTAASVHLPRLGFWNIMTHSNTT